MFRVFGRAGKDFLRRAAVTRQNFQQACGGVQAVVEAIPAFLEEDVAAHLAGQQCAAFLELGLDERMSGLPHRALAAGRGDGLGERARTFHVVNDFTARIARQHVARVQNHLPVRPDDAAVRRDHAEPVAVAVEREPCVVAAFIHFGDQISEVFRFARVGMVIGKGAVDLAKKLGDVAAELLEQLWREFAGDAIAAIHERCASCARASHRR